ncbi:MAG: 50S ribosomal protein L24 [Methanobacteriota archaeon]
MASSKPRMQRKRAANAPLHRRQAALAAHLDPRLHERSKAHLPRAVPVRKGDNVRIMRGGFRGREGTVVSVDAREGTVVIEGITIEKTDEKKVARPIHASNLMITKFDETDPRRRARFAKEP